MTSAMAAGSAVAERLINQQALVYAQMKQMMDAASRENRAFTPDEERKFAELREQHAQFERRIAEAQSDDTLKQEVERLAGGVGRRGVRGSSVGALFAANPDVAKFFKDGGHRRAGGWISPSVDVPYASLFAPSLMATTLTEDPASGGKLLVPDYQPGIVPSATRPI